MTLFESVAGVASIASFVAGLWQVAQQRGTRLTRWATFAASVLLLFIAGAGMKWFAGPAAAVVTTQTVVLHETQTVGVPPPPQPNTTETTEKPKREAAGDPVPLNDLAVVVVDSDGASQPQLAATATEFALARGRKPVMPRVTSASLDVRELHCRQALVGVVSHSTATESEASLQGLITTRLHLQFRLIDGKSGAAMHSFETDVRGAGYTNESSQTQANERAAAAIREKLKTFFE